MMKQTTLLLFVLAAFFAPGYCEEPLSSTKHYCQAEQLELTDKSILIHTSQGIYEIDSLLVDQGGIYFTEDMMRCIHCRRPVNPKNICECPLASGLQ